MISCNGMMKSGGDQSPFTKANGNRYYGGVLNLNEPEYFSLYPPSIIYAVPFRIASQVFETLVKFDQANLEVLPSLAESWEKDPTNTVYTFHLRKNVYFHDDPCFPDGTGRLLTAADVKACFENLCRQAKYDAGYKYVLKGKVKGAVECHQAFLDGNNDVGLSGVQVIDDHTLRIELTKPFSSFLYTLAMPYNYVFPMEAFDKYGEELMVGTGPFQSLRTVKGKLIAMKKNPNYYKSDSLGNQLPFLDSIRITFSDDKDQEVQRFNDGKLTLIDNLSTEHIIDILEVKFEEGESEAVDYIKQRSPAMSTFTYEFLTQGSVFSNVNLRKAFSYAIDRNLIMNKVLDGEAYGPGIYGFTPPVIEGYDVSAIEGYTLDKEKAMAYLKKAGYKSGADLKDIRIDINKLGGRNEKIANELIRQLKENLGVEVSLNVLTKKEKIERTKRGESVMYNREWTADFPSPENFLSLLYGRDVPAEMSEESYPNTARYSNPAFDELFEKGLQAATAEESKQYFMEAEKVAMADAPFLILVYPENYRLMQPYIRNLPNNPMQVRDYTEIWIDETDWMGLQQNQPKKGA